jgi:hypothetical protein
MNAGKVEMRQDALNQTLWHYEYREDGHSWHIEWDPRETQLFAWALLDEWDTPKGEPLDVAARERILDAVWPAMVENAGIVAIVDHSRRLRCPLAARWNRGDDGFLVDVHDGGRLDYLALGRTLRLTYQEPELYLAMVDWPASPRWCEPDGPIEADESKRIRERLQSARASDMRIGYHLGWRIGLA